MNWLHNGQPTGGQTVATTEAGSYAVNGTPSLYSKVIERSPGATWALPTIEEWYKAAYHENDGITDHYWRYPLQSNLPPDSDQPPGNDVPNPTNVINAFRLGGPESSYNQGYAVTGSAVLDGEQNYLTEVGAYALAKGPYGTYDQGGNLLEWVAGDIWADLIGGSWEYSALLSRSDTQGFLGFAPFAQKGFRVALVPEPSSFVLGALGLIGLVAYGWHSAGLKCLTIRRPIAMDGPIWTYLALAGFDQARTCFFPISGPGFSCAVDEPDRLTELIATKYRINP